MSANTPITELNSLATKYGTDALYATLFSTAPSGRTAGTEVSGITRQSVSWSAASNGVITATVTFSLSGSTTINGAGLYSAATGGTYIDGGTIATVTVSGSYVLTLTYTQS